MKTTFVWLLAATLSGGLCLEADVTYTETVRFNGGTMVDMVKQMANGPMGGRMAQAFQDQTYTVYVKGNKMARIGTNTSTITDLDAGTITNINHSRKTYSVITFEQMKQMRANMPQGRGGQGAMDFDFKVKKTGKTKQINGQLASETIITATAKGEGTAKFKSEIWTVDSVPGADELRAYQTKAAQGGESATGGPMGMGGANRILSAASSQAMSLGGVPLERHTTISGLAAGPMVSGDADPDAVAIDTTSVSSDWSSAAVDDSHFAVPAGYTKEERSMEGPGGRGRRPRGGDQPPQ